MFRLTPRICRAARSMLAWRQSDLASRSGVPEPTVSAFEAKEETGRLAQMNNRALVQAFEDGGLQFIPENGGGVGLRFAKPASKGEGA
jgi:hypothetical protein